MVPKNLIWMFMLSLIVLKHRRRNFSNLTTGFPRPYRVLPAESARLQNWACLAGMSLYGQAKPVVRFQKFLFLCFKTIKLSIKIHMRFLSTIFIHFDPVGPCLKEEIFEIELSAFLVLVLLAENVIGKKLLD